MRKDELCLYVRAQPMTGLQYSLRCAPCLWRVLILDSPSAAGRPCWGRPSDVNTPCAEEVAPSAASRLDDYSWECIYQWVCSVNSHRSIFCLLFACSIFARETPCNYCSCWNTISRTPHIWFPVQLSSTWPIKTRGSKTMLYLQGRPSRIHGQAEGNLLQNWRRNAHRLTERLRINLYAASNNRMR